MIEKASDRRLSSRVEKRAEALFSLNLLLNKITALFNLEEENRGKGEVFGGFIGELAVYVLRCRISTSGMLRMQIVQRAKKKFSQRSAFQSEFIIYLISGRRCERCNFPLL